MRLPVQFVNDVRKEDEIKFCPYCSRVLYYDETASSTAESQMFESGENLLDNSSDDEDSAFNSEDDDF